MQLDKVAVALRPRQGWEAVDLGFSMARQWARAVWSVWFAVFLPVALALSIALREWPWAAGLALWWLKPVFDRWVLHVLSRAVFGNTPSLVQTLAAWREVLSPGLAWSLVSRLWDATRSFGLPVSQLERQQGAPARARRRLLARRAGAHALGLTLVCVLFESVALYGLLSIGQWFGTDVQWSTPAGDGPVEFMDAVAQWWTWRTTVGYALAVSLIEPFYVAGGFALYLNRRVQLEGWDIEVALRRLGERVAAQVGTAMAAFLLIAGSALATVAVSPARAAAAISPASAHVGTSVPWQAVDDQATADDESEDDEEEPEDAAPAAGKGKAEDTAMCPAPYTPRDTEGHRAVKEILADPVFGGERKEKRWRAIPQEDADKPREASKLWGNALELAGQGLRVIAWIALAALAIALVWTIARHWQRAPQEGRVAAPTQLFGLTIAPESLPPDIAAAARALLDQGQVREALSLLYRGALSYLVHGRGLIVRRGATEGDVRALVRKQLPAAFAAYFERLVDAWVEAAYAARLPEPARVAELCALHAQATPTAASESAS